MPIYLPWMKVVQRNVSNFHMEPTSIPVQGTSSVSKYCESHREIWLTPPVTSYQSTIYGDLEQVPSSSVARMWGEVHSVTPTVHGWLFLVPLDICTLSMWKPHLLCIVLIMDKLLGKHFYPACECVFVKEYLPMKKREDTSRSRGAIISLTWHWWS